jgi:hypothetical protein
VLICRYSSASNVTLEDSPLFAPRSRPWLIPLETDRRRAAAIGDPLPLGRYFGNSNDYEKGSSPRALQ